MAQGEFIQKVLSAPIWSEEILLARGDYLSAAGERDQNVYWVQEGLLHFYLAKEEGEQSIRFAYQANVVSVLDSYISGSASNYYLQALRKSKLRKASKQAFEEYVRRIDGLSEWNAFLYQLIADLMEREQDLLEPSPKKRLERVLARSPILFQEVPHKYIASYLRMSPETLSRLMKS